MLGGAEAVALRLRQALDLVHQDRWSLAAVEEGMLRVLIDSRTGAPPPARRRPLSPLARRCLFERRPVSVTAVGELHADPDALDWQVAWPAALHLPVGRPLARPVGVLTLASIEGHWYAPDEVEYAAELAAALATWVAAAVSPPVRLRRRELQAALLLSEGLSLPELSTGLRLDHAAARDLAGEVMKKLAVRSKGEIADVLPGALAAGLER